MLWFLRSGFLLSNLNYLINFLYSIRKEVKSLFGRNARIGIGNMYFSTIDEGNMYAKPSTVQLNFMKFKNYFV